METAPRTQRVGGGRSAGVIAIVVALALGAVVWVGITGRRPAPPPTPPVVARASAADVSPGRSDVASPAPIDGTQSRSFFSVAATIGDRHYLAELEQLSARLLRGSFEIPIPRRATDGKLELSHVWLTGSHDAWSTFGEFDLRVDPLRGTTDREYVVLDENRRPGGAGDYLPQIAARGYNVTARVVYGERLTTMIIELRPAVRAIVGDDGFAGCRAFRTCESVVRERDATR